MAAHTPTISPRSRHRLALARDAGLIVAGCVIQAFSVVVFLAPADLAPGGVSGLALILNRKLPLPISIGLWVLLLNLPLLALGVRFLGGWRFLTRTIITVVLYSAFTALFERAGVGGVTDDILLNTLFGFIVISRAETATLKAIVSETDPDAFVVIGQAQEV